jgi:hypothetical protein
MNINKLTVLIITEDALDCNYKTKKFDKFRFVHYRKNKSTSYAGAFMTRTGFEPVLPP